jgi:hypothetical protein
LIHCFLPHNLILCSLQLLIALLNKLQISECSGMCNSVLLQKGLMDRVKLRGKSGLSFTVRFMFQSDVWHV